MVLRMLNRRQQLWVAFAVSAAFLFIVQFRIIGKYGSEVVLSLRNEDISASDIKVNFVFVLGLEGTGHHLYTSLMRKSPGFARLQEMGIYPKYVHRLRDLLYSQKRRSSAIWSAPCHPPDEEKPVVEANITEIQENLVELMLKISQKVTNDPNTTTSLSIPINGHGKPSGYGLVSYPAFKTACRPLQYPNLDVWYQVCERAWRLDSNIDCQHIYLYRDPRDVVRSNIKRQFDRSWLEAIHLYSTLLPVILYQLQRHPKRLAACWNFRQPNNEDVARLWWEYDNLHKIPTGKNTTNYQDFEATLETLYHAPPPGGDISSEFKGYVDSLVEVHEAVVHSCHELLHSQKRG